MPIAKIKVKVKCENKRRILDLYVLKMLREPLFGCEWLRSMQLNRQSMNAVQIISGANTHSVQDKLEQMLEHAAQILQHGIGTLKDIKANITIESNAQPKFDKAQPVPYSVCPKLESEDQGILSRVSLSD